MGEEGEVADRYRKEVGREWGNPEKHWPDKKTVYEFTGVQHARRALRPFRKAIRSAC